MLPTQKNDNMPAIRARLGDSVMEEAMAAGRALSLDQAVVWTLEKLAKSPSLLTLRRDP